MFGVAATPPGMAGVSGMYIIINCVAALENRYIGISTNIGNRFGNDRLPTITEMGFPPATMAQIHVVWGTVKVRNHPHGLAAAHLGATPLLFPGAGPATTPFPNWNAPGWTLANPPPGGGAFTRVIDGNVINLERLLIRFVMMRLGAGGTVSNNALMAPYNHPQAMGAPGAQPLVVKFHSAAFGNYNAFTRADILSPGFVW
jgi:hypothetical protein